MRIIQRGALGVLVVCAALGCSKTPTPPAASHPVAPSTGVDVRSAADVTVKQVKEQSPALPVQGGRIEGKILVSDKVPNPQQLNVGFVGKNAKGEPIGPGTGFAVDQKAGALNQSATCSTWSPLLAELSWDQEKGWHYKHSGLPPGHYLVFVQWGKYYFDAKWCEIKQPAAKLEVPMSVDPALAGTLEVTLPDGAEQAQLTFVPLDERDTIPLADVPMENWYEGRLDVKGTKVVLEGVRAAKYRISARVYKWKNPKAAARGDLTGMAQVQAGKTARLELKEKK